MASLPGTSLVPRTEPELWACCGATEMLERGFLSKRLVNLRRKRCLQTYSRTVSDRMGSIFVPFRADRAATIAVLEPFTR